MNDDDEPASLMPSDPRLPAPDPHGQAALLLVESLIHGLVARKTLTVADAAAIVEIAADVQLAMADEMASAPNTMAKSLSLLQAIGDSLSHDLPPPAPRRA